MQARRASVGAFPVKQPARMAHAARAGRARCVWARICLCFGVRRPSLSY